MEMNHAGRYVQELCNKLRESFVILYFWAIEMLLKKLLSQNFPYEPLYESLNTNEWNSYKNSYIKTKSIWNGTYEKEEDVVTKKQKKKLSNFFSSMFSYNQTKPDIFKLIHSVRTS